MSSHAEDAASQLHILKNRLDYFNDRLQISYEVAVQSLVSDLRDGAEECGRFLGKRHIIELDVTSTFALFLVDTQDGNRIASCYIDSTSPPLLKCTFSAHGTDSDEEDFVLDYARVLRLPELTASSTGVAMIGVKTWHKQYLNGEIVDGLSDFLLGELIYRGVDVLARELGDLFVSDAVLQALATFPVPDDGA